MSTNLTQLFGRIETAYSEVNSRLDDALNSFDRSVLDWNSFDAFKRSLTEYLSHAEGFALKLNAPIPPHLFHWGRCVQMLLKEFGGSGEKTAYEQANRGINQGAYGVLKAINRQLGRELSQNEIRARVSQFMHGMSLPDRRSAEDEYLNLFGDILPLELTEGGAARLRDKFHEVLVNHVEIHSQFQNIAH